jgi:hypothetical protein
MREKLLQSAPVRAQHTPWHGVPRSTGEQGSTAHTVLCFLWCVPFFPLETPFPGGPLSCPSHSAMAFGSAAVSARSLTRWSSRVLFGGNVGCVFPRSHGNAESPPSHACSPPGGSGIPCARFVARHSSHHPVWVRCLSHVPLVLVPTPHTQMSLVRRGHRTGRSPAVWFAEAELLFAGFRPPRVALGDTCCVVLVPSSWDGSFWSTLSHGERARDKGELSK